jgi:pantoate--beta-alanine ligase
MMTVETVADARAALGPRRDVAVGLVPTMGALHAGHRALLRAARAECDVACMSLFVNPSQFGNPADLDRYPRDLPRDEAVAAEEGVDIVFAPTVTEMYPDGFQTWIDVEELARNMEGAVRPGHFRAVATVCLKLFSVVQPDRAYFGQKDAQQAAVIGRMIADLNLPIELRVVPTVRDDDGLALSSRNVHLTSADRAAALALPRALEAGRRAHDERANADTVARTLLLSARASGVEIDYVEKTRLGDCLLLAGAIRVGSTRLIDNVLLEGDLP